MALSSLLSFPLSLSALSRFFCWRFHDWSRFKLTVDLQRCIFYPPPLLLYCDTKILANASFWKCAGKLTPYHLKPGCRQLWLHFRTLIDRFNSFLETEGHSDHRKPMWTVNLVMRRSSQSIDLWTDIQEDEVSFCRSPTDCLWWNLQCRLSADTISSLPAGHRFFNNFLNPWWVFGPH